MFFVESILEQASRISLPSVGPNYVGKRGEKIVGILPAQLKKLWRLVSIAMDCLKKADIAMKPNPEYIREYAIAAVEADSIQRLFVALVNLEFPDLLRKSFQLTRLWEVVITDDPNEGYRWIG